MNNRKEPAESVTDQPQPDQIIIPPALAHELLALHQRKNTAIDQAIADFNRDAGALLRGYMAAYPHIDPQATYAPNADFTVLTRQL